MTERKCEWLYSADFAQLLHHFSRTMNANDVVDFIRARVQEERNEERETWKLAYEEEANKFRTETLRTSLLTSALQKFIREHKTKHSPGPWSRGCELCELVGDAETLLSLPINLAPEEVKNDQSASPRSC